MGDYLAYTLFIFFEFFQLESYCIFHCLPNNTKSIKEDDKFDNFFVMKNVLKARNNHWQNCVRVCCACVYSNIQSSSLRKDLFLFLLLFNLLHFFCLLNWIFFKSSLKRNFGDLKKKGRSMVIFSIFILLAFFNLFLLLQNCSNSLHQLRADFKDIIFLFLHLSHLNASE